MQKNLVIVESPAKAKTIENFLGKDFKVLSSYGHIRDLQKKGLGIDLEGDYSPIYEVPEDKKKVVDNLKKEADKSEMVWLASDEDREGEAISWHLLKALNLDEKKTKRIVFHEITKDAITHAIENPRKIDINLVDAQQARRILDRIVGFELSPVLWHKVRPSLSAGRVQSVAVRLIVERERDIEGFNAESAYRIIAIFKTEGGDKHDIKAELNKRPKTKEEALELLELLKTALFDVSNVEVKPTKKSPAAPFTTSTLQQEASRKLGFPVGLTMSVAQKLYESGKITYMRTDSVNLSDLAIGATKAHITEEYGEEYSKVRQYRTKSKGAQEAHEAIRPTNMSVHNTTGSAQEKKLYDLIWKRTIASQMADAKLEKTTISIRISNTNDYKFVAEGEVLKFSGFLHVYLEGKDDEEQEDDMGLLPQVNKNETLLVQETTATERFTQRPARYTEASLVRKMEELGIGRPSTYAPTISTIQNREYVEKGDLDGKERTYNVLSLKNGEIEDITKTEITGADKQRLLPTDMGIVVTDFLTEYFPSILDYNFTARVEKEFDLVAEGEQKWKDLISQFYDMFHPIVDEAMNAKTERRVGERLLGTDPKSGKPVFVKIGRYGPMAQIGSQEDEEKPSFAGLQKSQSITNITLEEALKLFDLPRAVGEMEGNKVTAAIGRFGPYLKYKSLFVSLPKEYDPYTVTIDESIPLIEDKIKKEAEKHINTFANKDGEDIQILNGRFGPYISYNKNNYKIAKDTDPKSLSLEDCEAIIKAAPEKKGRKTSAKKTTASTKKSTAKKTTKTAKETKTKATSKSTKTTKTTKSKGSKKE